MRGDYDSYWTDYEEQNGVLHKVGRSFETGSTIGPYPSAESQGENKRQPLEVEDLEQLYINLYLAARSGNAQIAAPVTKTQYEYIPPVKSNTPKPSITRSILQRAGIRKKG